MENKSRLNLSKKFIDQLQQLPEKGMGFQIVDIELKDGTILKDRVVLNSSILKLRYDEKIEIEDIKIIHINKI